MYDFLQKLLSAVTQEQKAVESLKAKFAHVDAEGRCSRLLAGCGDLALRLNEACSLWDQYVNAHATLEDAVASFNGWIGSQTFNWSPPSSLEACQHSLEVLHVSHLSLTDHFGSCPHESL